MTRLRLILLATLLVGCADEQTPAATVPARQLAISAPSAGTQITPIRHEATFSEFRGRWLSSSVNATTLRLKPLGQVPALPGAASPSAAIRAPSAGQNQSTLVPTAPQSTAPQSTAPQPSLQVIGPALHELMTEQEISVRVALRGDLSQLPKATSVVSGGAELSYALRILTSTGQTASVRTGSLAEVLRQPAAGSRAELTVTARLGPASPRGSQVALRFAGTRIDLRFAERSGLTPPLSGTCEALRGCALPGRLGRDTVEVTEGQRVATLSCLTAGQSPWNLTLRVPLPADVEIDTIGLRLPDPEQEVHYSADGLSWSGTPVVSQSGTLWIALDYPDSARLGPVPCAALSGTARLGASGSRVLERRDELITP